jgi:hypothetical protein
MRNARKETSCAEKRILSTESTHTSWSWNVNCCRTTTFSARMESASAESASWVVTSMRLSLTPRVLERAVPGAGGRQLGVHVPHGHAGAMADAEHAGAQQRVRVAPFGLRCRPAVQRFRARVPALDRAIRAADEDGVMGEGEQCRLLLLSLLRGRPCRAVACHASARSGGFL